MKSENKSQNLKWWAAGYAAYWDGYPLDCNKALLTRKDNNAFVRGWLEARKEAEKE